ETPRPRGRVPSTMSLPNTHPAVQPGSAAAAWHARGGDLATWALARLVNRVDVAGGYYRAPGDDGKLVTRPTTRPSKEWRGPAFVTPTLLKQHFRASLTAHVLGLHAISPENTSRWGFLDVDHHGPDSTSPEVNLRAALGWYGQLRGQGFRPVL